MRSRIWWLLAVATARSQWQILSSALFCGCLSLFVGWLLVQYDFLSVPGSKRGLTVELSAVGEKGSGSRGEEVWFYGAFDGVSGRRLGGPEVQVPAGWETRGTTYIAFGTENLPVRIHHAGAVRLELGSHPYSGIASIAFGSFRRTVDLYSESLGARTIEIPATASIRWSPWRIPLLVLLFVAGCLLPLLTRPRPDLAEATVLSLMTLAAGYVTASAFYPGVYTNDSVAQMAEALRGIYTDWHPPMMAWTWSGLIALTGRTESLFLFHTILMVGGALCWVQVFRLGGAVRWGLAVPLLLISPLVANFSGVVWKDVGFASATLLASALAILAASTGRGRVLLLAASVVLSIYAIGIRPNGALASVPVFFAGVTAYRRSWPIATKVATTLLVTLLVWGTVVVTSVQVINPARRNVAQYLQVFDLVGISVLSGRTDLYPPAVAVKVGGRLEELERAYERAVTEIGNANEILFKLQDGTALVGIVYGDVQYEHELRDAWIQAVMREPWFYVWHRAKVFGFLMARGAYASEQPQSDKVRVNLMRAHGIDPAVAALPIATLPGALSAQRVLENTRVRPPWSWLYWGWLWLGLTIFALATGSRLVTHPVRRTAVLVLSTSALLYIGPYTIIAPASDFRYLYWVVIASALATTLALAKSRQNLGRPSGEEG